MLYAVLFAAIGMAPLTWGLCVAARDLASHLGLAADDALVPGDLSSLQSRG